MPHVTLTMLEGRTAAQKRVLLDGVHAALVDAFHIPEDDRFQFINELSPDDWDVPRSNGFIVVEIRAFAGRSLDAKRVLYKSVVDRLQAVGVAPSDVTVIVNDIPRENWGIRGGQAACDVRLGFKVDV